ncbi:MAG: hypothetical protein WC365_06605 [Candidatus Babeliales bacterium]
MKDKEFKVKYCRTETENKTRINKATINRASKALWRLEDAQDKFNEAIENLSDEELKEWAEKNDVRIEASKQKERIVSLTESDDVHS